MLAYQRRGKSSNAFKVLMVPAGPWRGLLLPASQVQAGKWRGFPLPLSPPGWKGLVAGRDKELAYVIHSFYSSA
jgi:hypothetical protein